MRESLQLRLDVLRRLDFHRVQGLERLHLAVGLLQGFDPAVVDIALDDAADDARRQRDVIDHGAKHLLDILCEVSQLTHSVSGRGNSNSLSTLRLSNRLFRLVERFCSVSISALTAPRSVWNE